MMVVDLKTKKFYNGQDKITYFTLTLNGNVIVTSFLYVTFLQSLKLTHTKNEGCEP